MAGAPEPPAEIDNPTPVSGSARGRRRLARPAGGQKVPFVALRPPVPTGHSRRPFCEQKVQVGSNPQTVTSYAYNQVNQLCWKAPVAFSPSATCGSPPAGATTYGYDLNGNQTSGGRTYGYNVKDQTTSINGTALTYLGLNQNELTGIGSDTFQNNGLGVAEQTSGANTYRFRRDPSGRILGAKHPGGRYYYTWDALGSTVSITGSAGTEVNAYKYEPYGSLASSTGTLPNPFKFAGGQDTGQGVYHFGARQYDPGLARWTQQDPLDQIGDLQEANRYMYSGGNPVNMLDPSGQGIADWVENRYHAGEKFIFSESMKVKSKAGKWGGRIIRAGSRLTAANWVYQCSKKLSGGDLAGNENQGDCDPLQPEPAY